MVEPDWGSLCFRSLLETHRFQRSSGWMVRLFWEDSLIQLILNYLEKVTNRREQVAILYPYHPIDSTNRCFPKSGFGSTLGSLWTVFRMKSYLGTKSGIYFAANFSVTQHTHWSTTFLVVVAWNLAEPYEKVVGLGDRYGTMRGVVKACLANNVFYLQRLTHGHHLYPRYATYIPGIRCLFNYSTWSLAPLFHAKTKHDISIQGDSLFRCYQRVCPFDTINVFGKDLEDHPRTRKWIITMVIISSLRIGFPLPNSLVIASKWGWS